MHSPIKADIAPLVEDIVRAVQPFAQTKNIQLDFSSVGKGCIATHSPEFTGTSLISLLCRIINFLPTHAVLKISILRNKEGVDVIVKSSQANLSKLTDITTGIRLPVEINNERDSGTTYRLRIAKYIDPNNSETLPQREVQRPRPVVPEYYAEIKKRLQAHYNTADNLVALTKVYNPADAVFLQKVNDIIFSNIGNESFDANKLASEIYLSRTQLFRKLKHVIGQSPSHYIKELRLQNAKKLLETTDKRVGKVAYQTGFDSLSHFTKAFTKRYGFKPSELKRAPRNKLTN